MHLFGHAISRASISREWAEIDCPAYSCVALPVRFSSGHKIGHSFKTVRFSPPAVGGGQKTPKPALRNAASFNFAWKRHIDHSWYVIPIAPSAGQPLGKNFNERFWNIFLNTASELKEIAAERVTLFTSKCTSDYVAGMWRSPAKANSNRRTYTYISRIFLFDNLHIFFTFDLQIKFICCRFCGYCDPYDFFITYS